MAALPVILVVDDEPRSLEALRRTLDEDFSVLTAAGAEAALAVMQAEFVQIILCDQRMPGMSGVEFLRQARSLWPDTVRIILSGYTETEDIIAGINEAGIWQYLLKPWQPEQLLLTLRAAAQMWRLQQDNQRLSLELRESPLHAAARLAARRGEAKARAGFERIVRAPDSPVNALCEQAQKIAPHDLPILLTGESGTGKELMARAIHYASRRAERAFVVENCGALPDQLLEAELFGHKRGAFTGAYEDRVGLIQQADGGTIFLDEIGDTSPAFQVKLLRALQEGEIRPLGSPRPVSVDVRVIAATNRDLEADVRAGRFREDLYYRLAAVTLHTPALRERSMDIAPIAQGLLARACGTDAHPHPRPLRRFSPAAEAAIAAWRWPGNVRELSNEIQRMLALADPEGELGAELLSPRVLRAAEDEEEERDLAIMGISGDLKERVKHLEARILKETLLRHRWNKSRAAAELGLSRVGLRQKIDRYGLEKK